MNTFPELMGKLKEKDQLEIIDLLHITSEELVDRFDDKIEDHYEELIEEFEESDTNDNEE